ncbi:MAG: alpha/beta hydrolase [Chitinophagaceae bacterium]|nr:MAG: alpha/beta hydrolase [Chitinophagaceae bacterium]
MAAKHLYYRKIEKSPELPWLVFVHGAGGSNLTWKRQEDFFKNHFNLLIPDLRDHGDTGNLDNQENYTFKLIASDLIKVLDKEKIREAHFAGVSMGTLVIHAIYRFFPERISSMILYGGVFRNDFRLRFFTATAKTLNYILPYHIMYRFFAQIVMPGNNHKKARNIMIQESAKLSAEAYNKWVGLYTGFGQFMKQIVNSPFNIPALACMGSQDFVFLNGAKNFAERNKSLNLKIIKNCGHVCNIERPGEVNKLSLNFLNELMFAKNAI